MNEFEYHFLDFSSEEVRRLIELAYSDKIEDKREAIHKINELEARFVSSDLFNLSMRFY